ncbi:undecaprenyl-phosphate glucose phosphotransferase [Vibrio hangzhouensis]|uniref:undecaprenyl-phosphate glucose phosphotransferase n=1 Tax=Vibrio hangzhouensis TaxID=462991 RepID=UPI001C977701|nr:undecaprenyl-phosphate glucose phosphotransferase [Vibrio hangzhouensis]MBY6198746.1 undecaprenyl-phosphate glucose phosphotransferase [Vibrio hangzhouensis]
MKIRKIKTGTTEFAILYRIIDAIIIAFILYISAKVYLGSMSTMHMVVAFYACMLFLLVGEAMDLYLSWRTSPFLTQLKVAVVSWVVVALVLLTTAYFSKTGEQFSRVVTGVWFVVTPVCLCLWRVLLLLVKKKCIELGLSRQPAIIVGVTESGLRLAEQIYEFQHLGIELIGFYDDREPERLDLHNGSVPLLGKVEQGLELARQGKVHHVYIAMPLRADNRIVGYLKQFSDTTANTYVLPDFFIFNLIQSRLDSVGDVPTLSVYDTPFYGVTTIIKRLQDIVLSIVILLMISPIMIAVAIGVKLSSPGPIIFKQNRYGLDGRRISVWKFRSMRTLEDGAVVKQAIKNDPRVTPFGAFIRRTSLDELPQFFNVLQGSMSIVGPRPHAVVHNEEYRAIVECYMLRHKVKPGITGLAQISGCRGETDTVDKMKKRIEFDLKYIESWSTWLDLKIIFLTIFKVLTDKEAY